jgi:hypothetical protein
VGDAKLIGTQLCNTDIANRPNKEIEFGPNEVTPLDSASVSSIMKMNENELI